MAQGIALVSREVAKDPGRERFKSFFLTAAFRGVVYRSIGRVLAQREASGPFFADKASVGLGRGYVNERLYSRINLLAFLFCRRIFFSEMARANC